MSFDRAKIEIAQPVAVNVSGRYAGAAEKNVVGQGMFFRKVIGEVNAGEITGQPRETGPAGRGN